MSEIQICKNCGKPIREFQDIHRWYHIDTGVASCYPDKFAVPEEDKCEAEIRINHQIYKCTLNKHDSNVMHRTNHYYTHTDDCGRIIPYNDVIEW